MLLFLLICTFFVYYYSRIVLYLNITVVCILLVFLGYRRVSNAKLKRNQIQRKYKEYFVEMDRAYEDLIFKKILDETIGIDELEKVVLMALTLLKPHIQRLAELVRSDESNLVGIDERATKYFIAFSEKIKVMDKTVGFDLTELENACELDIRSNLMSRYTDMELNNK